MEFTSNKNIFPDYKTGPLSVYRSKKSFDSKKLKLIIEDQATLELRHKVWNFMETNVEFSRDNRELSLDETRQIATRRTFVIFNEKFYDLEQVCYNILLLSKIFNSSLIHFSSSNVLTWLESMSRHCVPTTQVMV